MTKRDINVATYIAWANRKLGSSECKSIVIVNRSNMLYGWYDWEGTIYLNIKYCRHKATLYRVLAHEWTHAQQEYTTYEKLNKTYGYINNPFEIAAMRREKTCHAKTNIENLF
jgi:hypothetical protein